MARQILRFHMEDIWKVTVRMYWTSRLSRTTMHGISALWNGQRACT